VKDYGDNHGRMKPDSELLGNTFSEMLFNSLTPNRNTYNGYKMLTELAPSILESEELTSSKSPNTLQNTSTCTAGITGFRMSTTHN